VHRNPNHQLKQKWSFGFVRSLFIGPRMFQNCICRVYGKITLFQYQGVVVVGSGIARDLLVTESRIALMAMPRAWKSCAQLPHRAECLEIAEPGAKPPCVSTERERVCVRVCENSEDS